MSIACDFHEHNPSACKGTVKRCRLWFLTSGPDNEELGEERTDLCEEAREIVRDRMCNILTMNLRGEPTP